MYGIGAVSFTGMTDGSEKPIGYVSQTLTEFEKHYSQLEKKGLACIFVVKKISFMSIWRQVPNVY